MNLDIDERKSTSRQIWGLLSILGAGVVAACLLAAVMLYYYNPTGNYRAGNALLEPQRMLSLHFQEDTRRGNKEVFVFDRLIFSYYDSEAKQWQRQVVSMEKYGELYTLVKEDESLAEVPHGAKDSFYRGHTALLVVSVRPEGAVSSKQDKVFTQVEFSDRDDYYRIQLRANGSVQNNDDGWAYFYHPKIYQEVLKVFIR